MKKPIFGTVAFGALAAVGLVSCGDKPTQFSSPDSYRSMYVIEGTSLDKTKKIRAAMESADAKAVVKVDSGMTESEQSIADSVLEAILSKFFPEDSGAPGSASTIDPSGGTTPEIAQNSGDAEAARASTDAAAQAAAAQAAVSEAAANAAAAQAAADAAAKVAADAAAKAASTHATSDEKSAAQLAAEQAAAKAAKALLEAKAHTEAKAVSEAASKAAVSAATKAAAEKAAKKAAEDISKSIRESEKNKYAQKTEEEKREDDEDERDFEDDKELSEMSVPKIKIGDDANSFKEACRQTFKIKAEDEKKKMVIGGDSKGKLSSDSVLVIVANQGTLTVKPEAKKIRGICVFASNQASVNLVVGKTKITGLFIYERGNANKVDVSFNEGGKFKNGMAVVSGTKDNSLKIKGISDCRCKKFKVYGLSGSYSFACSK